MATSQRYPRARNCARLGSMSTATLVRSTHNLRQTQVVSSSLTVRLLVKIALRWARARLWGAMERARVSTYVYYNEQAGGARTTATTSAAHCRAVSEKTRSASRLSDATWQKLTVRETPWAKDLYETIHSHDCYSLAIILLRCMRAIEKTRGKCVGC